jgi:hypothetical protein
MNLPFPEARPHFAIPKGFGFHRLSVPELKEMTSLLGVLQIWELPQKGHRYVMSADVADGIGKDRSSIDIVRMGTIERVEEQVAHYISDQTPPRALAYVMDAIGRLYRWPDGREALAAIECNNHGLSVQDTLQLHLGYKHFYIWEVLDQADPQKRFTTRMGWVTTNRTRPILLDQLYTAVTTIDPISGYSDLRVNSSFTFNDMRDFQTDGALWEAEAARGAHDDCIISLGIGHYVAHRLAAGESEPLEDRRRRRHEEEVRRLRTGNGERRDFRNSDSLAADAAYAGPLDAEEEDDELSYYDPDGRAFGGTLY